MFLIYVRRVLQTYISEAAKLSANQLMTYPELIDEMSNWRREIIKTTWVKSRSTLILQVLLQKLLNICATTYMRV